jgi:Tfp pilus assembly protein PilV
MGLIELLIALTVLTVAIGGLLAVFASSVVTLRHSSMEGTAITLADRQLESYRSMPFNCIPNSLPGSPAPSGCGTYVGFPNPYAATQVTSSSESPDHRVYKVTTAASCIAGCTGNPTLQLTATVALNSGGPVLAQETSYFSSAGTSTG